MTKIIDARVRQKIDTESNWNNNTLKLLSGEQAFVSDTRNFKIGDGTKTFSELEYFFNLPTDVYSKTQINNRYQITTERKELNANTPNGFVADRFTANINNGYALSVGYATQSSDQFRQYSTNFFVKANNSFFNFSAHPSVKEILFTCGLLNWNGSTTSNTGWQKLLAFTENDVALSAPAFNQTSLKGLKENITTYEKNALDLVNSLEIVRYDYKDENAPKNMIGVIVDEDSTDDDFKSELKNGIDLYKMISIVAKSVQELSKKING